MVFSIVLNTRKLAEEISKKLFHGKESQFLHDQALIEDLTLVLNHLEKHQQIEKYIPRFKGKQTQVIGALAESRISYFLEQNGFKICTWEPAGAGNYEGDFTVQLGNLPQIFVEVKAPTWEGELTREELLGERKLQPKYLHAEARFADPVSLIVGAIEKALPKFEKNKINLLAVGGYLSFLSPFEIPRNIFEPKINYELSKINIEYLGGIFILDSGNWGNGIQYKSYYIRNPVVQSISSLPEKVEAKLCENNQTAFFR